MNSSSRFAAATTVRSHRSGDEAAWWTKTGIDPAVPARVLETYPLPKALDIMDPERATSLAAGAVLREAASVIGRSANEAQNSRVEDGRGGCALKSPLRFPSPLIKPDVLISSIRLSDRHYRTTHGGRPLCARIRCETASPPNTSPKENREVPPLLTLCRL